MLTYEETPTGSFRINSYDLPALGLQDTKFAWAFIRFDEPISPLFVAGDFNHDGAVNVSDYQMWRSQYGQTSQSLSADGNRDGIVDAADYVIWRRNLAASPSAGSSGVVPEPASIALTVLAATPFWAGRLAAPWFVQRTPR